MKNILLLLLLSLLVACGGGSDSDDGGNDTGSESSSSSSEDSSSSSSSSDSSSSSSSVPDDHNVDAGAQDCESSEFTDCIKLAKHHMQLAEDYPDATLQSGAVNIDATHLDTCFAPCGVHFQAEVEPEFGVNSTFRELAYHWDFDDPESVFEALGADFPFGRSANHAQGPMAAHVFARPGTYEVRLSVAAKNGNYAWATSTIEVVDPDPVFPANATACVSVSGEFADCPADALQYNDPNAAVSDRVEAGTGRILLRAGEEFVITDHFRFSGNGPYFFSRYGEGDDPVIRPDETTIFSCYQATGFVVSDIAGEGAYDATTGMGHATSKFVVSEDCNHLTVYRTHSSGFGINYHQKIGEGLVYADNVATNWSNFGSLANGRQTGDIDISATPEESASKLAYVGNRIRQHPEAVSGPGGTSSDLPRWADHGPLRATKAFELVVNHNDFYSNTGWSSNGRAHQPTIRYNTSGDVGHSGVISENFLEGGFESITAGLAKVGNKAKLGNLLIERNRLKGSYNTRTFFALNFGNTTIRNNIATNPTDDDAGPDIPADQINKFHQAVLIGSVIESDENRDAPRDIFANTLLNYQSGSTRGVALDFVRHDADEPNNNIHNNIFYSPDSPDGDFTDDPQLDENYRPSATFTLDQVVGVVGLFDTYDGQLRVEPTELGAQEAE